MSTATAAPTLLPLREAAERFGLGQSTLYRYIRQGNLTRHRRATAGQRRGRPVTFVDAEQLSQLLAEFARMASTGPEPPSG